MCTLERLKPRPDEWSRLRNLQGFGAGADSGKAIIHHIFPVYATPPTISCALQRQRATESLSPEDEPEFLDSVTRSRQPPDKRFRLSVDTEKGTGGIGTYPDRGCVSIPEVSQGEKDTALGLLRAARAFSWSSLNSGYG